MVQLQNDVGHGRNTYPPSKGVPTMAEFEFNNAVGKETKRLLQGKVPTFEAQPFDGLDVSLTKRTNLYNAQYAKNKDAIGISIHANANGKPSVRGFGVFYWHTSKESKKLAEIILDEYKKEFPEREKYPIWGSGLFPSVPKTWTDLHMCRETDAIFCLVEYEFMTNSDALVLLKSGDYRKRCAKVNAKSVCRWYGIEFDEPKPPTPPVPQPPLWDGSEIREGQIGRLTILKPINLWKDNTEGKLELVRVLNEGEIYRVYGYRNDYLGQYNLGNSHWVTKMEGYILYETPSKSKLQEAEEYYKNN